VGEQTEEEMMRTEEGELVEKYFVKSIHTIEVLFNQLNMMYFWEKLRMLFADTTPSLSQTVKLMVRCSKLYHLID
jgi:hypothetical protein